jgi:hypothetical protein
MVHASVKYNKPTQWQLHVQTIGCQECRVQGYSEEAPCIVEIRRHSDDCVRDILAKVGLSCAFHLSKDHGGDLFGLQCLNAIYSVHR